MTGCAPSGMERRPVHRRPICRYRFFPELEPYMSTARFEHAGLRGIAAILALATAFLANGCGDGLAEPVSLQGGGPATSEKFHTLGGTISGLTRTGLVLANGANIVSVAANTTSFTLPTPVAYADGYGVTVAAQPAGLSCMVSN